MNLRDDFTVGEYVLIDSDQVRGRVYQVARKLKVNYDLLPVGGGKGVRAPGVILSPAPADRVAAARTAAADNAKRGPELKEGRLVLISPSIGNRHAIAPGTVFAVVRISTKSVTVEPISGEGGGWRVPSSALTVLDVGEDLLGQLAACAA